MKPPNWPSHRHIVKPEKRQFARDMRSNQTETESLLWERLRCKRLGFKFRRQAPLYGYIADFWCPSLNLIIEVDGGSHINRTAYDKKRDRDLAKYGIKTVRIPSERVLNELDALVEEIEPMLRKRCGEKWAD